MSYEITPTRTKPLTKIKNIFFGSQKDRPEFAHPWSAYSPATYMAGTAPIGIVIATKAQSLLDAEAKSKEAGTAAKHNQSLIACTAQADAELALLSSVPQSPELAKSAPHTKLVPPAPTIAATAEALPDPIYAALACATNQNFQLAARLQSVSKLNRALPTAKVRPGVRSILKSGSNRLAQRAVPAKRIRSIVPPAVLHKQRKSAQVIQLNLALARAQEKQIRASQAA